MNWRTLNVGDEVKVVDEEMIIIVTKVCDDHVMAAECDGVVYWIDDNTANRFRR